MMFFAEAASAASFVVGRALIASLAAGFAQSADDWPRWRGPGGDGSWNPQNLPPNVAELAPKQLWTAPIGGGYSGVTVSCGCVFLMDRPKEPKDIERVVCHAAGTGAVLWTHEWPARYGSMEYGNGPRASVTIYEGRAYALGATGTAACLDAETGKVVWQVDTVANHGAAVPTWGFAASPMIDGGRVLLHVGAEPDGSVIALNRHTGRLQWRGGPDPAGYCTPEIITHNGARQLIAWGPKHIQSLDPENGATFWTYPYEITYGVSIAQPLFRNGLLLVSGYWHGTKVLKLGASPHDVELLWENEKGPCGLMSAPLFKDGNVFILDKNKGLQCVELQTGTIRWSDGNTLTPKERNPQLSLVWAREKDGLAALLNASGELVFVTLQPDRFEEITRHQVIGKTWAHPAFAGNRIYARSDTELAAWQLWD